MFNCKKALLYIISHFGNFFSTHFLFASPLSMLIWIYGIYLVLTPLFVHFREPDGTNLVHTVAQKAADLGAAIAIVWFIFKLVSIVDFHLKKWAASTDSTIDDVLPR